MHALQPAHLCISFWREKKFERGQRVAPFPPPSPSNKHPSHPPSGLQIFIYALAPALMGMFSTQPPRAMHCSGPVLGSVCFPPVQAFARPIPVVWQTWTSAWRPLTLVAERLWVTRREWRGTWSAWPVSTTGTPARQRNRSTLAPSAPRAGRARGYPAKTGMTGLKITTSLTRPGASWTDAS